MRGACSASIALPRPTIVRTCRSALEEDKGGDDDVSALPIIILLAVAKMMLVLAKR